MSLKTAFTGRDNESLDIGRILWALAMLVLCGLEGWKIVHDGERFDAMQFALATGSLLAAGGVGLKVKASTEPGGQG